MGKPTSIRTSVPNIEGLALFLKIHGISEDADKIESIWKDMKEPFLIKKELVEDIEDCSFRMKRNLKNITQIVHV